MSQPTTSTMPSSGSPDEGPGSSMKEQAAEAKDAGLQVAASAKEEGMAVVEESRKQAADLMREATSQLQEQAGAQKGKAVEGLRSLGEQLQTMASGADAGPAADLAHQASGKVSQIADWLDQNDPSSLLDEMRSLAQRKPGTFLLGALAAGVVAGRVTRGVQGATSSGASASSGYSGQSAARSTASTSGTSASPPMGSDLEFGYGSTPTVVGTTEAGLPR